MSDSGILNTDGPGGGAPGFWDGRSLGEEPTVSIAVVTDSACIPAQSESG